MPKLKQAWGCVTIIYENEDSRVSLIELDNGKETERHIHNATDELIYLLNGAMYVENGGVIQRMFAGDRKGFRRQIPHKFIPITKSIIIEIAIGEFANDKQVI